VMTGGAGIAAIGGASFFKGTCKYQDSGSVGASVMEGAGSFVFAYAKLTPKFARQEMVLAFVQAPYKTGTELVAGKSFSEAAALGAVKLAGPGVDRLLKIGPAKTLFDRLAIPIVITYGGQNVAAQSLSGGAGVLPKAVGAAIKKAGEYGARAVTPDSPADAPAVGAPGRLVRDATISDKFLLYLAFVNMTKGIGHGW
jgi:hypothetical protein